MHPKNLWSRIAGLVLLLAGWGTAHAMLKPGNKGLKIKSETKIEAVKGEFVVQLNEASTVKSFGESILDAGIQVKSVINASENLVLVKVQSEEKLLSQVSGKNIQKAALTVLSNSADVKFAEPNYIYRALGEPMETIPGGAQFTKLWGMKNTGQADPSGRVGISGADIGATKAWALSQGSKDIVVAVIDTGVDYNHPALKANIWKQAKVKPEDPDVFGYNAINDSLDPMDDHSHGTHCSGTIGASGANPDGVVGVTWNVRIMGVKFLSGSGSGTLADAIKAIDWAAANGAQIMSNSWGGGGFSQALLDSITRAKDKGILFVAAAGNSTANNDTSPSYPASYDVDNVVAVAATNNSDELAYFSNYGTRKVHLAAPGMNILSTVPGNDRYTSYSGTSMACPHVSGAAALLLGKEPSLSYADLKARLLATSDKVRGLSKKVFNGNRLNVYNLLTNTVPPGPVLPPESSWSEVVSKVIESEHPYKDGAKMTWTITHPGATYLRIKFGKFETETGYDVVKIKSKSGEVVDSFSGALGEAGFISSDIEGDTATIEFTSDSSVNRWGFIIDGYKWTAFKP